MEALIIASAVLVGLALVCVYGVIALTGMGHRRVHAGFGIGRLRFRVEADDGRADGGSRAC